MRAVKSGQADVVRALLNKYADVDAQDEDGRTAMHFAIDKGHTDILALILGHKPNTELRSKVDSRKICIALLFAGYVNF